MVWGSKVSAYMLLFQRPCLKDHVCGILCQGPCLMDLVSKILSQKNCLKTLSRDPVLGLNSKKLFHGPCLKDPAFAVLSKGLASRILFQGCCLRGPV